MIKTPVRAALALSAVIAMSVSGCRCDRGGVTAAKGELAVVYIVDGVSKTAAATDDAAQGAVYDFGKVPMGKQAKLKMVVKNAGVGALFLDKIERLSAEGDGVAFAAVPQPGDPAQVVFRVAFEKAELSRSEAREFELTFDSVTVPDQLLVPHEVKVVLTAANTQAGEESTVITLKGDSVSGECDLPKVLDFGAVSIGDSFTQSVTFKNTRPIVSVAFADEVKSNSGDDQAFVYLPESPRGEFEVGSNKQKDVSLSFTPTANKEYAATVKMRAADGCPDVVVKLVGTGRDRVLEWVDPMNFGYVTPGLTVQQEQTFSNWSLKPVRVYNFKPASAEYKVVGAVPEVIVPAASRDTSGALVPSTGTLMMSFKPNLLGPRNSQMNFNTDVTKQAAPSCLLKGYGGGPDIDVKPATTLNFGRVAYFAGSTPPSFVTRKLTIFNVGTRPTPPDPRANLKLGPAGSGDLDKLWEWKALNSGTSKDELCIGYYDTSSGCTGRPAPSGAGSYDPSVGLEALGTKAILDVPVRVTPSSTGTKEWEVTIHSNDPDEADVVVTVKAEAVVLPPCDLEVMPVTLNFGLVTPPDYKDLNFTVKNRGTGASDICLISALDMQPGSDAMFTLPAGAVDEKELQPQESMSVIVRAWPKGNAGTTPVDVSGLVKFNASNPSKPEWNVTLNASIGASCLTIVPDDLDFGTVQKDCSSQSRTFTIYNTCSGAVVVNSFSMVAPAGEKAGSANCGGTTDCPEFIIVSTAGIAPGTSIAPGAVATTFSLKYHPINFGADSGAFLLKVTQNGNTVDYIITLHGVGDTMGLNTDTYRQDSKPKADILLVIDNSGSMYDKQQSLSTNFDSFIKYAKSAGVDYQIGVTTTDTGVENGSIVSGTGHPEKILTPTTVDVENKFKAKVNVGTVGSGLEEILAPAVAGLTPPKINNENVGLVRQDAVLAVVAVTDATDQSALAVSYYANALLNVKGAQNASMFSFNAVSPQLPSAPSGCSYDDPSAGSDPRIREVVTLTNGVKEEICTPDWAKALEQIGKNAFGYRTSFFLKAEPDLSGGKTITVSIEGMPLDPIDSRGATVWTYDAANRSVNFEPLFVPEPGKTLEITYYVTCYP